MIATKNTKYTKGDDPTFEIIGCAMEVQTLLGPGLLESVYEKCLAYELTRKGFALKSQVEMPLKYKDIHLQKGYRIDLLIEDIVVVEIKAIESVTSLHEAQILSYMRLAPAPLGLLINFNALPLKSGIKRFIL